MVNADPAPWKVHVYTRPLSGRSVKALGQDFPQEFRALFAFEDVTNGQVWTVAFYIKVTDYGTPEVLETIFSGASETAKEMQKRFVFPEEDSLLIPPDGPFPPDEAQKITREQLRFVGREWERLLRTAMINVAEKWQKDERNPAVAWTRGFGNLLEHKFESDEKRILRKAIDSGLRAKIDDEFLKKVSVIYLQAAQVSHKPTQTVAEYFSKDIKTAQGWVTKARALGMIPPGERGRVSKSEVVLEKTPRPSRPKSIRIPSITEVSGIDSTTPIQHPGMTDPAKIAFFEQIASLFRVSESSGSIDQGLDVHQTQVGTAKAKPRVRKTEPLEASREENVNGKTGKK